MIWELLLMIGHFNRIPRYLTENRIDITAVEAFADL
jgi:hypothetical protein